SVTPQLDDAADDVRHRSFVLEFKEPTDYCRDVEKEWVGYERHHPVKSDAPGGIRRWQRAHHPGAKALRAGNHAAPNAAKHRHRLRPRARSSTPADHTIEKIEERFPHVVVALVSGRVASRSLEPIQVNALVEAQQTSSVGVHLGAPDGDERDK